MSHLSGSRLDLSGKMLARNTMLNLVGQGIPLLIGVIVIPLLVRGLGTDRFGLLSLAWVILGYFSLFDLGLGRATTKFVAETLGKGDLEALPRLVWTSFSLHLLLGVAAAVVLGALSPLFAERVFTIPAGLTREAETTFLLLAASVPLVVTTTAVRGVLEASQRFDLVNAVKIPASSLTFLLPALAVRLGLHLPGIILLLLLSRVATLAVYLVLCFRTLPALTHSPSFDRRLLRPLLGFGGWITVSNAVGPAVMYLDRFLIGSLVSMAAVSFYTAPYEVVFRLWILPASLVMTLFPAFSAFGTTQRYDLGSLYVRSVKYLTFLMGPIVLTLVLLANVILRLWLGPDFGRESTLAFQILCIGALVGCLAPIPGSLLQGLGRPDLLSKLYLVELPINVPLVWFLTRLMGINGAALSFTLRTITETVILMYLSSKLVPKLPRHFAVSTSMYLALVLSGLALLTRATPALGEEPTLLLLTTATLLSILILGTWRFLLNEDEKGDLLSALREALAVMSGSLRGQAR